jgi:DNA replicative helicase MCM subunit Mcm2 (Cdc46/Mcm family)
MDLTLLTDRIREAVKFAKTVEEVKRDHEARKIWINIYPELSEGQPGLIGAVLSRAEAQVMRLALTYALMDCSRVIQKDHLYAALALWDYSEASVRYIFKGKTGDDVADRIHEALQKSEGGLTRTDIMNLFDRHQSKERIDEALDLLSKYKRVNIAREATGGRPTERITRDAQ